MAEIDYKIKSLQSHSISVRVKFIETSMTGVQINLIFLSIFAFGVTFGRHIEGMDVLVEKLPDDSNEFKIK